MGSLRGVKVIVLAGEGVKDAGGGQRCRKPSRWGQSYQQGEAVTSLRGGIGSVIVGIYRGTNKETKMTTSSKAATIAKILTSRPGLPKNGIIAA